MQVLSVKGQIVQTDTGVFNRLSVKLWYRKDGEYWVRVGRPYSLEEAYQEYKK